MRTEKTGVKPVIHIKNTKSYKRRVSFLTVTPFKYYFFGLKVEIKYFR